jgi:hypothetical protein
VIGRREDVDRPGMKLDVTRVEARVLGARRPPAYEPFDAHDALDVQVLHAVEGLAAVVVEDHLGLAVMVAEVDEDDAFVVPDDVYPAGESRDDAVVLGSELTASVGSIGIH